MKKCFVIFLIILLSCTESYNVQAQIPILSLITGAAKKVIKAIDLQIQRQQNKVIWLQNAQKILENEMSRLKLGEIGDWVSKQKDLYRDYFDELAKVKDVITYYNRIRDITEKQANLVTSYKLCWSRLSADKHFSGAELGYMASVYNGILNESIQNLDQISTVLQAFTSQMSDAERLSSINKAADKVDANYNDLQQFNFQNSLLSLQRAKDEHDIQTTKALYGLK